MMASLQALVVFVSAYSLNRLLSLQAAKHPGKNADQLVHHVMRTWKALCGDIDEV